MRALALVVVVASGCYSPALHDGQYACTDANHTCPSGLVCSRCGVCVAPTDAGTADGCPGCAVGTRSVGDQSLFAVAFCNGAWSVPGVTSAASMATPCNRQPGDGGSNAAGTACSVEDNCAPGWHVCVSDKEANTAGLSPGRCDSTNATRATFWTTRQAARVDPLKGAACASSGSDGILGCGSFGTTASCPALTRWLGNTASPTPSTCGSLTGNVWQCGTTPGMEATLVTKSSLTSGGGVLCCRD